MKGGRTDYKGWLKWREEYFKVKDVGEHKNLGASAVGDLKNKKPSKLKKKPSSKKITKKRGKRRKRPRRKWKRGQTKGERDQSVIGKVTGLLTCIQEAGDLMYIPQQWGHAVRNIEISTGIAVEVGNDEDLQNRVFN